MDIFKLFFNHDQRLDKLAQRNTNRTAEEKESSLEDFMTPDRTYSKLYITGTRLEDERFGINTLNKADKIIDKLDRVFTDRLINTRHGTFQSLTEALDAVDVGEALVISSSEADYNFSTLEIDDESNVGHKKEELAEILKTGAFVVYKEKAHHGYDLHLFTEENIYSRLFENLQPLVDDHFRFFSINSKRMGSERHFYFETWTLEDPPHGAEEVFPGTVL